MPSSAINGSAHSLSQNGASIAPASRLAAAANGSGDCLDQPHLMAGAGERQRLPQAGNPGADDENLRHILPFGSHIDPVTIIKRTGAPASTLSRR